MAAVRHSNTFMVTGRRLQYMNLLKKTGHYSLKLWMPCQLIVLCLQQCRVSAAVVYAMETHRLTTILILFDKSDENLLLQLSDSNNKLIKIHSCHLLIYFPINILQTPYLFLRPFSHILWNRQNAISLTLKFAVKFNCASFYLW